MDLNTVANVATALTVITGVAFGLIEAQRSRRARQERAAYAAVQAMLSPEWMRSMITVHNIPTIRAQRRLRPMPKFSKRLLRSE